MSLNPDAAYEQGWQDGFEEAVNVVVLLIEKLDLYIDPQDKHLLLDVIRVLAPEKAKP